MLSLGNKDLYINVKFREQGSLYNVKFREKGSLYQCIVTNPNLTLFIIKVFVNVLKS